MFFIAGILFSKIATGILDLGIVVGITRNILNKTLLSLIMIAQEIEYLRELRIQLLKQKHLDEEDIQFQLATFDSWFTKWKESVIINFIALHPIKEDIQFHNWKTATEYVETLIKQKKF